MSSRLGVQQPDAVNISRHFALGSPVKQSKICLRSHTPEAKLASAKQIISFLPPEGRTYVEPFVGCGNLFWAAAEQGLKFRKWWLNDLATAPFFDAIKELGETIQVPPRSRREFEKQREAFKYGDPTAVLLAPHLSFSGGLYDSGLKGGAECGDDDGGFPRLVTRERCVSATGFLPEHVRR